MDMLPVLPQILICALAFFTSLFLSIASIPRIIFILKKKRIFDIPDHQRKVHTSIIPNLGGVAIFFSFMIVTALLINPRTFTTWNYFAAAALILLVTGIRDDMISLPPVKKLISQVSAAVIVVWLAGIRLETLHGFLGIYELPVSVSIILSGIGCEFITNAFNLIDGIDGLAASIGALASFLFGVLLYLEGNYSVAIMSFSLMGAILGFLRYNISPARIFMGDTGSMVIGFSIAVIAILFVRSFSYNDMISLLLHSSKDTLIMALSILFIPVFDTLRVFTTRSLKGRSPFRADKTHLHHYLLDLGLSHTGTVLVLLTANVLIIGTSFLVQDYSMAAGIAILFFVAFALFTVMYLLRRRLTATVTAIPAPAGRLLPRQDFKQQPKESVIMVQGKKISRQEEEVVRS